MCAEHISLQLKPYCYISLSLSNYSCRLDADLVAALLSCAYCAEARHQTNLRVFLLCPAVSGVAAYSGQVLLHPLN